MLQQLPTIVNAMFSQFDSIWLLYTGGGFFSAFFALYLLDKMFHIFDILKR